jgi:predicted N-acetyltransferase YhbS
MEFRTQKPEDLDAVLELLSRWELPHGGSGADRLRRQAGVPGSPAEQNVWVATERGEIVSCAQIHERRLRILGHGIPTGGIGSVYTDPSRRGQGIATSLVECAATAMRERGMELSLAFSDKPGLFERLGWRTWKGQRSILRRSDEKAPSAGDEGGSPAIELVPFESRDRALSAVKAIHSAYSGPRHGTVIRDDASWEACMQLAGNPAEEFWVARRGGLAVAYARATLLSEGLTITELGRFEDGAAALAKLVASFLEPRSDDPLVPVGQSSAQIRSFLVLPTFDDIGLTVGLEHEGVTSHPVDDDSGLVRCLNLSALSARLDVDLRDGEDEAAFLRRILPPDGFVFWPADRF